MKFLKCLKAVLLLGTPIWSAGALSSAPLPNRTPVTTRLAAVAESKGSVAKGGTSSQAASVFNLCKSIMGAGALSLPASVCAIGNVKGALVPSISILAVMGFLSAYTFSMIGEEV